MNYYPAQRVGNYRLIRLLAQSRLAEVYLGEHVDLKMQAAIKILRTRLTTNNQESFLTEARSISSLSHPNIVRVLEAGVEGNMPFLVMTYTHYDTLRQCYPAGTRVPQERILSYAQQIAAALQYAHDQKLIHRDVRPENMLLGPDNSVLLTDFDLTLTSQSSFSQSMQDMMGTVIYRAPEHLKGQPCPASDQYALGIVIYEWLSGDVPFHGSFTEIANQHMFTPPQPLHEKIPEILPAIEEVVQIALAKEPKWRFANMRAFAHALEQASKLDQPPLEARTFYVNLSSPLNGKIDSVAHSVAEEKHRQTRPDSSTTPPPSLLMGQQVNRQRPPSSYPPIWRRILLVTLALLVTISGIGGLVYYTARHPTLPQTQNTSTSQVRLTAQAQTAQARGTTNTNVEATAEASATAEAEVTATAESNLYAEATQGTPIIDEALSQNIGNQWDENTSSRNERCTFTGGAYHIIEPQPGYTYPCFANGSTFSNFAFQVQMTIIKGDVGGLVFFADSAHTHYCASILNNEGNFAFFCYVNSSSSFTVPSNSVVGQKSPQPNLLTVIVHNNRVSLYVNKQYVGSIVLSLFSSGGEIGMVAYDIKQPTEVAFSHAQVWSL
ncbi:MAG: serine/threonine protein kinase [Chloroflexi bacterium]|nr:serine/threonine protein kinase [Chloroflexota bacterium]